MLGPNKEQECIPQTFSDRFSLNFLGDLIMGSRFVLVTVLLSRRPSSDFCKILAHRVTVTKEPADNLHPSRHVGLPGEIEGFLEIVLSQSKMIFGNPLMVENLSDFPPRWALGSTNALLERPLEEDSRQEKGEVLLLQILFPVP
jgi:hypothetical protein